MSETPSIQQLFDLSGRVALVTGASGHLGRSLAEGLAEAGCRVIVASRDHARGGEIARQLGGRESGRHLAVVLDHLDETAITRGFSDAVAAAGRIDVLVNNGHEAVGTDWTSVTGEQFTRQLANATGYFLLARLMHQHAVTHRIPVSIILLGSMYGVVGSYPETYAGICSANPVAYQTLKGGIVQMTRHLAVYWAADGVRVNCLSPGPFPSERADPRLVERLCARSPMQRMGRAHELKGAVVFLASDASSYMTGQNLLIDGGWTAW